MARRRQTWTQSEVKLLTESFDRPIQELIDIFPRHSKASINRKIARLRKAGRIGYKSKETVDKSYNLRHIKL